FKGEEPLTAEAEHYRLYPLIPFDPQKPFETYYLEIDPGTTFHGEPHEGEVYEYVFVTKGALQVKVGDEVFQLKEREFLQFQANYPHEYKCLGKGVANAIMQIIYLR
ncbi:MAG: hypothetical protein C0609_00580, partial [Deltaproteobacteria bacterium]